MPASNPVITVPTVLPRLASEASVAAAGIMSCATVAAKPIARLLSNNSGNEEEKPHISRVSASSTPFIRMIWRRS
ncbi:hypothetical protein D3C79_423610 [compost metagenome]